MCEDKQKLKKEMTKEILSVLKDGSCRVEIIELLKLSADSMKNSTYRTLLDSDMEYNQMMAEEKSLLESLRQMDLKPEQQEAVEKLADKLLESEYHVITNAYMAGILDGYKILRSFDLTYE
ncbi:MAG: hypothetical protein ACOX8E_10420 [Ruminococcus sp.]|jgi:hypothetical protein